MPGLRRTANNNATRRGLETTGDSATLSQQPSSTTSNNTAVSSDVINLLQSPAFTSPSPTIITNAALGTTTPFVAHSRPVPAAAHDAAPAWTLTPARKLKFLQKIFFLRSCLWLNTQRPMHASEQKQAVFTQYKKYVEDYEKFGGAIEFPSTRIERFNYTNVLPSNALLNTTLSGGNEITAAAVWDEGKKIKSTLNNVIIPAYKSFLVDNGDFRSGWDIDMTLEATRVALHAQMDSKAKSDPSISVPVPEEWIPPEWGAFLIFGPPCSHLFPGLEVKIATFYFYFYLLVILYFII